MSTWATMKHHLFRDLHIDTTTSGSLADTDVGRAIVESILFNRNHNLGWNQGLHVFHTNANQFEYPLPSDYLALSGDVYYSTIPDSEVTVYGKRPLKSVPMGWIRENRYRTNESGQYVNVGVPGYFGIDPSTRLMHLSPAPSDEVQIEYVYLRDPGTPTFKSDGTTWTFYTPNTDDTLSATYTNEWFDVSKGYHLILNRAMYLLCVRGYGGTEEMDAKGANALRLWAEEMNRLRAEANNIVSVGNVRRHI